MCMLCKITFEISETSCFCIHSKFFILHYFLEGMTMTFSGDDRDAPVVETITIDVVTQALSLFVKSYETTDGVVTYSWDATEPCDFDNFGCRSCDDYAGCKDGLSPVCDGDHFVECVEPSLVPTARLACKTPFSKQVPLLS